MVAQLLLVNPSEPRRRLETGSGPVLVERFNPTKFWALAQEGESKMRKIKRKNPHRRRRNPVIRLRRNAKGRFSAGPGGPKRKSKYRKNPVRRWRRNPGTMPQEWMTPAEALMAAPPAAVAAADTPAKLDKLIEKMRSPRPGRRIRVPAELAASRVRLRRRRAAAPRAAAAPGQSPGARKYRAHIQREMNAGKKLKQAQASWRSLRSGKPAARKPAARKPAARKPAAKRHGPAKGYSMGKLYQNVRLRMGQAKGARKQSKGTRKTIHGARAHALTLHTRLFKQHKRPLSVADAQLMRAHGLHRVNAGLMDSIKATGKSLVTLLPTLGVGTGSLVLMAWGGTKLGGIIASKWTTMPESVKPYAVPGSTAVLSVVGFGVARMVKPLMPYSLPILLGGLAAAAVQLMLKKFTSWTGMSLADYGLAGVGEYVGPSMGEYVSGLGEYVGEQPKLLTAGIFDEPSLGAVDEFGGASDPESAPFNDEGVLAGAGIFG